MDRSRTAPTIDTCQGLVVLQFLPTDELIDIVYDGFPFMAWLAANRTRTTGRRLRRSSSMGRRSTAAGALARDVGQFGSRPTDRGDSLTLFWDDPDQTGHWLDWKTSRPRRMMNDWRIFRAGARRMTALPPSRAAAVATRERGRTARSNRRTRRSISRRSASGRPHSRSSDRRRPRRQCGALSATAASRYRKARRRQVVAGLRGRTISCEWDRC